MKLPFLALTLAMFTSCAVPISGPVIEKVSIDSAERKIAEGAQVLDVRTREEWDTGHLEEAVRVDIKEPGFAAKAAEALDESKPVVVYCRSGNRSAEAVLALNKAGFATLYDMDGGITAWTEAGKQVVQE